MNSEFTIAVHCLLILSDTPDRICSSESLSAKVHTHPARIRKIMSLLRRRHLVETKEGLGGGYRLACDPASCTLADVYRLTSCAALKLSWCSDPSTEDREMAAVHGVLERTFSRAENLLENYLEHWTIDSLLKQIRTDRVSPRMAITDKFADSQNNRIGGEG